MKRLFTFLLVLISGYSYTQCTPVAFSGPGFLMPDTNQELSVVNPLHYYYQEITTYTPVTYDVGGLIVPIDSSMFESVAGLPPGLSIALNIPPNLGWHSGTNGCFVIMGQSSFADAGAYQVVFTFRVFALTTSQLLNFQYTMVVVDSVIAGEALPPLLNNGLFAYMNDKGLIVRSETDGETHISVNDIFGRTVFKKEIQLNRGENTIHEFPTLSPQLLLVRFEKNNKVYSQKVILH